MEKEVQYFLECAHKCAEAGLLSCSSGNLSLRCKGQDNEDCALLSATGSWLGELQEDQVALCRISDGTPLNGVRPTMEAGFHLGTMRKRPEVGCVLHFQSPCATVVACMKDKPADFNVTLEDRSTSAVKRRWCRSSRPAARNSPLRSWKPSPPTTLS